MFVCIDLNAFQITIFEQYELGTQLVFSDEPDLGPIAKDDDDDDKPNSSLSFVAFGWLSMNLWFVALGYSLFQQ